MSADARRAGARARRAAPAVRFGSPRRRVRWLLIGSVALLALCLLRAAQLQVVRHGELAERARGQQEATIVLHASRGDILDRSGQRLAISQEGVTVGADVALIADARRTARAIVRAIPSADVDELTARLEAPGVLHVDLVRQADPDQAAILRKLKLPGVTFTPEERRIYPAGVAGQVLGIVDIDGAGQEGIEARYERVLHGEDGAEVRVRDPQGETISVARTTPAKPGQPVWLTIDRGIQADVERLIAETHRASRAKSVTALVLDPKTGGILAVASSPGPGPGAEGYRAADPEARRLRAFTDQYEPGSTFKAVTLSAGLSLGRLTPSTTVEVSPSWTLYDRTLTDAHPLPTGAYPISEIIKVSSNIGTAKAAYEHLSGPGAADKGEFLAPFIDRVGFGKPTGVDFPGESAGTVKPYASWSGVEIMTVPIGHGIAVTPAQLGAFYAALANGGKRVCPHLVERIGDTDQRAACAGRGERLFPAKTARQMTQMLAGVVSGDGTGTAAAIPGYSVAGKTGTTKKIDDDGTYSSSRYVAWFVGYAPTTNPRVVTLVMVDEPQGEARFGGQVAAPAFAQITSRALLGLGVRQDRPETAAQAAATG